MPEPGETGAFLRSLGDSVTRGNLPKLAGVAAGGRQAASNVATYTADKYRDVWENIRLAGHGSSEAYNDMLARNFPEDVSVGDWRKRADESMLERLDLAEKMATRPAIEYRNPLDAASSANLATQIDMARGLRLHPEAARAGYETGDAGVNAGMRGVADIVRIALRAMLFPMGMDKAADTIRSPTVSASLPQARAMLDAYNLRAPGMPTPTPGTGMALSSVLAPNARTGGDPIDQDAGHRVVPGETDEELAQWRTPSNPWYVPSPQIEAAWAHGMRKELARGGSPHTPDRPSSQMAQAPEISQRPTPRRAPWRPNLSGAAAAQQATDQEILDAMQAPY